MKPSLPLSDKTLPPNKFSRKCNMRTCRIRYMLLTKTKNAFKICVIQNYDYLCTRKQARAVTRVAKWG